MRQIRPRTSYPTHTAQPVPTGVTIDLRTTTPALTAEQLRERICEVRTAISDLVDQLSELVEKRESLKTQLSLVAAQDRSIVAWGFCEDDDL